MGIPMVFDYDPESGEYFSRPADEFDGVDPQDYEPDFNVPFHLTKQAEALERRMGELREELLEGEDGCSEDDLALNAIRLESIIHDCNELLAGIRELY